ncbi:MAG: hypothetical protein M1831_007431 [Alyxoria varia]|nr:MAG: hypothetical protein M1831_007431 [Alyxoria varia]
MAFASFVSPRCDAGQSALPGGKADDASETPLVVARREAFEEVGLPLPDYESYRPPSISKTGTENGVVTQETKHSPPTPGLPFPFSIEHLCQFPTHLARTELGVRPCVALLRTDPTLHVSDGHGERTRSQAEAIDVESMLMPRLDAKEVAAVYTAPLSGFLSREKPNMEDGEESSHHWYSGTWVSFHDTSFRMHSFYVPAARRRVLAQSSAQPPANEQNGSPNQEPLVFRVFGLTARILVDCARLAYAKEPDFEHNGHFGDEELLGRRMVEWEEEEQRKDQRSGTKATLGEKL